MQLATVGLLVIREQKLLPAFSLNKQCFYLPGGKKDAGETAVEAICREIEEELNTRIEPGDLEFFTHISAPAFGENKGVIMEQDCYLLTKDIRPSPAAEIGELRYFTLEEYLKEKQQAPGAIMILKQLKEAGFIQ